MSDCKVQLINCWAEVRVTSSIRASRAYQSSETGQKPHPKVHMTPKDSRTLEFDLMILTSVL